MKGAAHTKSELLVTDDERTAKMLELLGHRFSNHGQLLLPTFRQYEALNDDEGLQALAKEFCRWLGYKPRQLVVTFSETSPHTDYLLTPESITINHVFRDHPLVVGGLLANATIAFILQHHHFTPDDRFIEVASVETGLSLWVINALQPRRSKREKLYHMLDGNWVQLEGLQLKAMSVGEYLRQFMIFTSTNRLFPEEYGKGVSKRSVHLLPSTPSNTPLVPLTEPTATLKHIHDANALWAKISLLSVSAAALLLVGLYLWHGKPAPVAYEQTRDTQALRIIKASLGECIQKASEQQSTFDPNDLFMARQVDATKTRCESLRNQYNEALSQYETNYLPRQ